MNTLSDKPTVFSAGKDTNSEQWKNENADALESSNNWVDANGLPLEEFKQF